MKVSSPRANRAVTNRGAASSDAVTTARSPAAMATRSRGRSSMVGIRHATSVGLLRVAGDQGVHRFVDVVVDVLAGRVFVVPGDDLAGAGFEGDGGDEVGDHLAEFAVV